MRYLALCCIVKDETPFLKEWVAYHTLLGVEHFIIYDNMSVPSVSEVLGDYAGPELLTIRRVQGTGMQMPSYQNCLDEFGSKFKWIGFLDMDEFVCPMRDTDLRVLLSEFEPYAALGLTWKIFSSGGHLKRPEGLSLAAYTELFPLEDSPDDVHIKSFIQPARTLAVHTPHAFFYAPGEFAVTEDHRPIPGSSPFAASSRRLARVNHYYHRSQQDFEHKLQRGRADSADPYAAHKMDRFYVQAKKRTVRDRKIFRFLPELERLLAQKHLTQPKPPCPEAENFDGYMAASLGLMHAGKLNEAQLCLCYASLRHADQVELWVLRAMLARLDKALDRAEHFLNQALKMKERPQVYLELIKLRLLQGRNEEAHGLKIFLRDMLCTRGIFTQEWRNQLESLNIGKDGSSA